MTGVQRQAEKLLEQIKDMSFIAARSSNMHLDIGKMEILLMALEKQVPGTPDRFSDGYCPDGNPVWDYLCPRCGYNFEENETNYCPKCGQAIDWRIK